MYNLLSSYNITEVTIYGFLTRVEINPAASTFSSKIRYNFFHFYEFIIYFAAHSTITPIAALVNKKTSKGSAAIFVPLLELFD